MADQTPPFTLVAPDDRRTFWIGGQCQSLIVGGEETAGRYALSHSVIAEGAGASEHIHGVEAEAFYVLCGELEFSIAGESRRLGRGSFLHVEPGLAYSFNPVGEETAEVLVIYAPADLEHFIAEVGIADSHDASISQQAALHSVENAAAMKAKACSYGLTYTSKATS